jgi:chromosome segregation ATPase
MSNSKESNIVVEKAPKVDDDDNDSDDTTSDEEETTWKDVAGRATANSAGEQVIRTPPNESVRGRGFVRGRGGHGRGGQGRNNPTIETLQGIINSQNAKLTEQANALKLIRENFTGLQQQYNDLKTKSDNLEEERDLLRAEKESRIQHKEERRAQKASKNRETVPKSATNSNAN